jgi:hypothetical protein
MARTKEELEGSRQLIFEEYTRSGYISDQGAAIALKTGKYLGLPGTATFILRYRDDIIGTMTIVRDGKNGVPMDDLYAEEINVIRKSGLKIAEVTQFAMRKGVQVGYLSQNKRLSAPYLSIPLLKLAFHYALLKEVDTFCIAVNPKHAMFYKSLYFEQFGEEKVYMSVNGAPAVALTLDIKRVTCCDSKLKDHFVWGEIFSSNLDNDIFDEGGNSCLEYDAVQPHNFVIPL